MDTTKSFEGVISEITLIFEEALSGVKSTTLLYTIPEKLLHKEDRSLGHSLLDAENPANKMATQTVIKTMLRKPFFLNRPLCNVANFSPSLEFFISIVNKHCHFCQETHIKSNLTHFTASTDTSIQHFQAHYALKIVAHHPGPWIALH